MTQLFYFSFKKIDIQPPSLFRLSKRKLFLTIYNHLMEITLFQMRASWFFITIQPEPNKRWFERQLPSHHSLVSQI